MHFSSLALALFAAVATAAPASQDANAAKAIRGPCIPAVFPGTPPNITAITPGTVVTGLYVSNNDISAAGGAAILSTDTTINNRLEFDDGTIAAIEVSCSPFYLQIGASDKSYKPLTWDFTEVPNIWDAGFDKIIKAKASGSSEFLACKPLLSKASDPFTLYLQTGTDRPVGLCATTKLKISKNGLDIPETK